MQAARVVGCLLAVCLTIFSAPAVASDSPLADAAKLNSTSAARDLLEQAADVDAAHADGMTALHWAAYHDNTELTRLLVAAQADVTAVNRYGVTPLSIACTNGNTAIVELLLKSGADANAALRGGETVLMTASRTGRVGPVQALLAHGAKVDARERKGQTALMWAAAEGHADVVDTLIEAGADYRTPLPSGFTPLFFAVREGRTEATLRLLKAGIDVNAVVRAEKPVRGGPRPGTSPLILAVENGHFELAATLLDAGADPNAKGTGYTALHALSWVRKPIRGDGDPPPQGSGNLSSLDLARRLVAKDADVNSRHADRKTGRSALDREDATPFLLASESADLPLMRLLLELGADPLLANAEKTTPLLATAGVGILGNGDEAAATEEEVIEAIRLLLERGADINAVDQDGNSAMHGAAYKSWTKVIRFLADNGADVAVWNRKNKRGWTPLLIAQGNRPGNFRPSAETIVAIEKVMREGGARITQP